MWKHPNLRVAYVAQHAFHHVELVRRLIYAATGAQLRGRAIGLSFGVWNVEPINA